MIEIIPAILTKDSGEFAEMVKKIEPFSKKIHLDIADGVFVPNKTIGGIEELNKIESCPDITVHLMIKNPEEQIGDWLKTSATGYIFHIETTGKPLELIKIIRENKKRVGIALNPKTPIETVMPYIEQIDFVHFMTVEPGFYGSKFEDSVVQKIADFHKLYPNILISVDGGVTPETAPRLTKAGATMLISGSYIFKNPDPAKAFEELKQSVYQFKNSAC